ncbi:asparagine synthase-related protein [Pelagibacteraceae bacterium]|jgi:asparagine synthase (glutamine-hydrolysing)|nr:asparagine synthase-related protein [Pelagibacteraceae bacterium]
MCGVLVIFSKKNRLNKSNCLKSLDELHSRGPDKKLYNFFSDQRLFIGNSILKITGKIKKGNELYKSINKKIHISFNGEIYNYEVLKKKFLKLKNPNKNDTEILANLHDQITTKQVLKYIDGMFAYTAYNQQEGKIFFATDPQGEKRLFKYEDKDYLIISSTPDPIKKFINQKLEINNEIFRTYFKTRHFLHLDKTIYDDISYLTPGELYTLDINKDNFSSKKFDDPISWINKKQYRYFKKIGLKKSSDLLKKKLITTSELMSPTTNFGTICSGGVDSTLISYFLKNNKFNKFFICLNNQGKDPVADNITSFKDHFDFKKFRLIKINLKGYFFSLSKTYKYFKFPFLTHDLVGRLKVFEFFKKKKVRVCFSADGADEIFGGYSLYKKINWNKPTTSLNQSPYSNIKKTKILSNEMIPADMWKKAYKKYNKFLSPKESRIQASLFTDYFVQAVGVHNISNDILAGECSIEIRNVYTNRNIIKFALNLPIEYKLNLKNKSSKLKTKLILKNVFTSVFGNKLLFKKQGFSGFPNESKKLLSNKDKKSFLKICQSYKKRFSFNHAVEWKILNLFYYNKFNKKRLNIQDYF